MKPVRILLVDLADDLLGDVLRRVIDRREGMTFAGHASPLEAERLIRELGPEVVIFGTDEGGPPAYTRERRRGVWAFVGKRGLSVSLSLDACTADRLLDLVGMAACSRDNDTGGGEDGHGTDR